MNQKERPKVCRKEQNYRCSQAHPFTGVRACAFGFRFLILFRSTDEFFWLGICATWNFCLRLFSVLFCFPQRSRGQLQWSSLLSGFNNMENLWNNGNVTFCSCLAKFLHLYFEVHKINKICGYIFFPNCFVWWTNSPLEVIGCSCKKACFWKFVRKQCFPVSSIPREFSWTILSFNNYISERKCYITGFLKCFFPDLFTTHIFV